MFCTFFPVLLRDYLPKISGFYILNILYFKFLFIENFHLHLWNFELWIWNYELLVLALNRICWFSEERGILLRTCCIYIYIYIFSELSGSGFESSCMIGLVQIGKKNASWFLFGNDMANNVEWRGHLLNVISVIYKYICKSCS